MRSPYQVHPGASPACTIIQYLLGDCCRGLLVFVSPLFWNLASWSRRFEAIIFWSLCLWGPASLSENVCYLRVIINFTVHKLPHPNRRHLMNKKNEFPPGAPESTTVIAL